MNTRTERMNNKEYCAYCGTVLRDYDYGFCPEPPLICNCENAKRELVLYDELKNLYKLPLAESLIDMKVNSYRNKLLGIPEHTYPTLITGKVCVNPEFKIRELDNKVEKVFC